MRTTRRGRVMWGASVRVRSLRAFLWLVLAGVLAVAPGCRRKAEGQGARSSSGAATAATTVPGPGLPAAVAEAVGREVQAVRVLSRPTGDILGFRVSAAEALATWEKVHAVKDRSGLYPVIFAGGTQGLPGESVGDDPAFSPAAKLGRAANIAPAAWFPARMEDLELHPPRDPAGTSPPNTRFVLFTDLVTGEPRDDLLLLLVPTTKTWEVLAILGFGGWNDCPTDEAHAAAHKLWFETYGAELVAMDLATLELRVARPPTTRDAALALALQQYAYCYDIVEQGVGSLEALAAGLANGSVWFFWWD